MAADGARLQGRKHPADGAGRLLDGLAAGKHERCAHEVQGRGVGGEVGVDLPGQVWDGGQYPFVQQDETPAEAGSAIADQRRAQGPIARRKQVAGENDGKGVLDGDALEMHAHAGFQESFRVTVRLKIGAPGRLSGSTVK